MQGKVLETGKGASNQARDRNNPPLPRHDTPHARSACGRGNQREPLPASTAAGAGLASPAAALV
ncbi:hypothetical protein BRN31_13935, partial [Xanthomonas oryzae pv. oryzae]